MEPNEQKLKIMSRLRRIKATYAERPDKFNLFLQGDVGTGKTTLAATAPQPILFHSFDPGGTDLPYIDNLRALNAALVEDFSTDDPKAPTAFEEWYNTIHAYIDGGLFDYINTYVVDGLTGLSASCMYNVVAKSPHNTAGGIPQIQDYNKHQDYIVKVIREICSLPCNFIFIVHSSHDKDELTGRLVRTFVHYGRQLGPNLPHLFGEVWATIVKGTGKGAVDYYAQTNRDGLDLARTRMGSGKFDLYEKNPTITSLLTKAGKKWEHRTLELNEDEPVNETSN